MDDPTTKLLQLLVNWRVVGRGINYQDLLDLAECMGLDRTEIDLTAKSIADPINERNGHRES